MAASREIKNRIRSIGNTHKITKTMENVSQSKTMKLLGKVNRTHPYLQRLNLLIYNLIERDLEKEEVDITKIINHPLYREHTGKRVLILCITSNRGLCGGYNTHVVNYALERIEELKQDGREVTLYVLGKKGNAIFRYRKQPRVYVEVSEHDNFENSEFISSGLMQLYLDNEVDEIEVISTHYFSKTSQAVGITTFLPFQIDFFDMDIGMENEESDFVYDYVMEPSKEAILNEVIPLTLKTRFYLLMIEAFLSEQIQRGMAMKTATDNADEMIKSLTMALNRARQTQITGEMIEIISGSISQ